jgi:hypothetical protein
MPTRDTSPTTKRGFLCANTRMIYDLTFTDRSQGNSSPVGHTTAWNLAEGDAGRSNILSSLFARYYYYFANKECREKLRPDSWHTLDLTRRIYLSFPSLALESCSPCSIFLLGARRWPRLRAQRGDTRTCACSSCRPQSRGSWCIPWFRGSSCSNRLRFLPFLPLARERHSNLSRGNRPCQPDRKLKIKS